jgi:PPM family protein phosphatase
LDDGSLRLTASKIRYQGTRPSQQDAVRVFSVRSSRRDEVFVAGVLTDGIGGLPHGKTASEVVNAFCKSWIEARLAALDVGQEIPDLLAQLPAAADRALATHQDDQALGDCGTTLVAAVIAQDTLYYISVGDSLIFATTAGGDLQLLNALHSRVVEGRSMLTAAILGRGIDAIDKGQAALGAGANRWVLIASDGIRTLTDQEIIGSVEGCEENPLRLMIVAAQRKKLARQDNMAMILFRTNESQIG